MAWSSGWQFPPGFLDFVQIAVPPTPDPYPGYGEVVTVYSYAQGHVYLFYQPSYMRFDPYLRDLANAMGDELSVLRETIDTVLDNFFLEHTSEWGLQIWEAEAGVAVAPDNVSDDNRRAGVRSRIIIGPRTLEDFLNFIEAFTGNPGSIIENYASYTIDVGVFAALTDEEQEAFETAFEEALPAHIGVDSYTYGGFVAGINSAGDSL